MNFERNRLKKFKQHESPVLLSQKKLLMRISYTLSGSLNSLLSRLKVGINSQPPRYRYCRVVSYSVKVEERRVKNIVVKLRFRTDEQTRAFLLVFILYFVFHLPLSRDI